MSNIVNLSVVSYTFKELFLKPKPRRNTVNYTLKVTNEEIKPESNIF